MRKIYIFILLIGIGCGFPLLGQNSENADSVVSKKKWYESINLRGYAQLRYNGLFQTNPNLRCEQCDKSWGGDPKFSLRRVRLVFYGQIAERVYFYIQPDFASSNSPMGLHVGQLRDAYFDVGLDKDNEFRFRFGQSKIPFGFENMQSSSNRLPLDRDDALNSALKNERDLGIMFYWAPREVRDLYRTLSRKGLKHSGDYGALGLGIFNGQTANSPELNSNKHFVVRFTYPIRIGNQIIEPGIQAYRGRYEIPTGNISEGVTTVTDRNYLDQRLAASFVLFPQPFGIQAEYNIGEGPEFSKNTNSIRLQNLHGGYITLSYLTRIKNHVLIPFTRVQHYDGGKKHELDARSYDVKELEVGIEWQPVKQFELVAMYTYSSRRFEDYVLRNNRQTGSLFRFQAQVNF